MVVLLQAILSVLSGGRILGFFLFWWGVRVLVFNRRGNWDLLMVALFLAKSHFNSTWGQDAYQEMTTPTVLPSWYHMSISGIFCLSVFLVREIRGKLVGTNLEGSFYYLSKPKLDFVMFGLMKASIPWISSGADEVDKHVRLWLGTWPPASVHVDIINHHWNVKKSGIIFLLFIFSLNVVRYPGRESDHSLI